MKRNSFGGASVAALERFSRTPFSNALLPNHLMAPHRGLIFLTLENESTHANDLPAGCYEKNRQAVLEPTFVRVIKYGAELGPGFVYLRAEHIAQLVIKCG